jgi:hypothetical protein
MISSLLPPRDIECPAITTATNANFSLQLIVELLLTGTKQVAPATIFDDSFKFIDDWLRREQTLLQLFFKMLSIVQTNLPCLPLRLKQ